MQLKSICGPRAMIAKYHPADSFNCLTDFPFWATSGKYYYKKRGKILQL